MASHRAGAKTEGPWSSRWWRPDRALCSVFRLSFSDSESDNSADSCLPSREPPPSKKPPPPNSKVSPLGGEEEEEISWVVKSLPSCPGGRAEGWALL